jgi:hypothetical protein
MKSKKIAAVILIFSLLLSAPAFANEKEGLPEPGITPDNPFYFTKGWVEKAQMFFTFSPEGKTVLSIKFADQRLAEAEIMEWKGKPELIKDLIAEYDKHLKNAERNIKRARLQNRDTTKALEKVAEATSKHTAVLQKLLSKVPPQAQDAIKHAIEVSQHGRETALKNLQKAKGQEKKPENREKSEAKSKVKEDKSSEKSHEVDIKKHKK